MRPRIITVQASCRYDILLNRGGLDVIGEAVAERFKPCTVAVMSDDIVFPIYGRRVTESLNRHGFSTICHIVKSGESYKTLESVVSFIEQMVQSHITRTDMVLALGGGVVGDMAGFAGSIYLRGIPYIQVPTTLLAAVDSSVGGKTGVDINAGKNLIGAFHQPALVYIDPETLQTLPTPIMRDGFAEVIKYGIILDEELSNITLHPHTYDLEDVIARCISIKRNVVEQDEKDLGVRALLNFGHTFGHAIEQLSGFSISHGCAVAKGMVIAAKVGVAYGLPNHVERVESIVQAYGFDTSCPYSATQLYTVILSDKKRSGSNISLILPESIGHCISVTIPIEHVLKLLVLAGL